MNKGFNILPVKASQSVRRYIQMLLLLTTLFGCLVPTSYAQAQRELVDAKLVQGTLQVMLSDAKLSITAINEGTVEVFYQPEDTRQLPSFALPEDHPVYRHGKLTKTASGYSYKLPKLTLKLESSPFSISFYNEKGLLASEEVGLFNYETIRGFRFDLSDNEVLLGGGQRVLGMNRRGHRMPLYNKAHYGYTTESNQMYYSLPVVMSNKAYVIAFDNSANGFLDIGHTQDDVLQFEADAGRTAYIFSAGNDYYDLVENFVGATGKQPLPPRWALGNYASRFGYKNQQEVLDTIDKFIKQDFPVDAVVLDLYWFGADIKGHMGNLQWDSENWPEPEKMIKTLADKGVNTIMITEPFILSSSKQFTSAVENGALAKDLAGKPKQFDFYFGNTGLVDVFDEKAQDWFWQFYRRLNDQGVVGWWGDLGEPEVHPGDTIHQLGSQQVTANEIHNAYGHKWAQMVYNKQKEASPNRRPFIMMRSGFVGSQRYGMIPWTGDVDRSWGGLKPQVELALQMSMFGLAYMHSDLGGFAGGETFDAELYTRWLQYGAFQPVYRPHAQDHIAPEPVFHDIATQDIVRKYVKLRYRLLPYNYSLSMLNSLRGIPMMRPLFMDYAAQDMSRTDAYLWGDAFLIAPVIKQGQTQKDVLLPEGIWFDYWQNTRIDGGQMYNYQAPLDTLPVFVKAGAFVPSVADMSNTKAYTAEKLRVDYYADAVVTSSAYTMYEDDGKNPNSIKNKQYQTIVFASTHTTSQNETWLNIDIKATGNYQSMPTKREITMVINGLVNQPNEVKVDSRKMKVTSDKGKFEKGEGVFFDQQTQQLFVRGFLVKHLTIDVR